MTAYGDAESRATMNRAQHGFGDELGLQTEPPLVGQEVSR